MIDKQKKSECAKRYYEKNKEAVKARVRAWREANKEKKQALDRAYYAKNSDVIKARSKLYYHLTKDDKKEKRAEWARNNMARKLAANRRWFDKNKDLRACYTATRRLSQRMATPIWVCAEHMFVIKEAYRLARLRTAATGINWHVDHIIPIRGKNVCGLHVMENLQVIPAVDNVRKSNRYEV